MDRVHLMRFKMLFEEQMRKIQENSGAISESLCVQSDDLLDTSDLVSSERDSALQLRLKSREQLYLAKIKEALARITQGTFGECESCGLDIGEKRLQARPTATCCVLCKEEQERNEQNYSEDGRMARRPFARISFG